MSIVGPQASPLSRKTIRHMAGMARQTLGYGEKPYIKMDELLEFVLPKFMPEFFIDIRELEEMGNNHGVTAPDECWIEIRSDIYDGMCNGKGRDRLTAAHELAHLLLHKKKSIVFSRQIGKPVTYRDPEWQADCFAGEFLMPTSLVKRFNSPNEAALAFGVSRSAADYQWRQFKKEGIIK